MLKSLRCWIRGVETCQSDLASVSLLPKIQNITANEDAAQLAPDGWQLLVFDFPSDVCELAPLGCYLRCPLKNNWTKHLSLKECMTEPAVPHPIQLAVNVFSLFSSAQGKAHLKSKALSEEACCCTCKKHSTQSEYHLWVCLVESIVK